LESRRTGSERDRATHPDRGRDRRADQRRLGPPLRDALSQVWRTYLRQQCALTRTDATGKVFPSACSTQAFKCAMLQKGIRSPYDVGSPSRLRVLLPVRQGAMRIFVRVPCTDVG